MPLYVLYLDKGTFFHRLDPRTKLLLLLGVFIWTLVFNHPIYTGFVLVSVFVLLLLARTIKQLRLFWFGLLVLGISSLILWPIFRNRGEFVLFSLLGINIHYEAFLYGVAVAFRLIAMVLSGLLLLTTTKIEELEAALTKIGMPYAFAFGFSSVFRFIPTMVGDGMTILAAQQARGVNLMSGSILSKMRNSASIIVPLFITTMRRFGDLPMAIESRGFVPTAPRSFYIHISARPVDYIFSSVVLFLAAFSIYLRFQGLGVIFPDVI